MMLTLSTDLRRPLGHSNAYQGMTSPPYGWSLGSFFFLSGPGRQGEGSPGRTELNGREVSLVKNEVSKNLAKVPFFYALRWESQLLFLELALKFTPLFAQYLLSGGLCELLHKNNKVLSGYDLFISVWALKEVTFNQRLFSCRVVHRKCVVHQQNTPKCSFQFS